MQDCRVGGGRDNGEKDEADREQKKNNLCSSEGLNSPVESGSINLVLPQSASRSTAEYLRFCTLRVGAAIHRAGVTGGR